MLSYLVIIIIGYLFGCIQSAYIYGRAVKKVDIRTLGQKNAGATNAAQSLGISIGVIVVILDILKAVAAAALVKYLFPQLMETDGMLPIYVSGASVVLGHNYPFFMNFKGGKGTASTVGMLFSINMMLGALSMLVILVLTIVTDYIVFGTLGLLLLLIGTTIFYDFGLPSLVIAILLSLQSIYKHLPNFKRILRKEEKGLRATIKKQP
ncbi:glycerol-3-phosphate acyltransferase [Gudongella sp. DL1XJH-153]|uniref:glycerol-3-phosphate acyltransferase n=1 Tax=Gudongella sp. DL1XJH-153 TaxID=3409804 RepID=UPI003BB490D6